MYKLQAVVSSLKPLSYFVQYYKLAFRIVCGAGPDTLEETVSSFLSRAKSEQKLMTDLEDQREADFGSLVNLCGWDAEPDLEKDFWVFVIVVFYLGTKLDNRGQCHF